MFFYIDAILFLVAIVRFWNLADLTNYVVFCEEWLQILQIYAY